MQWLLTTRIGRALSWASVAALAAFGIYWKINEDAEDRAENKALRDNLTSQERGRHAVAKEKRAASGASDHDLIERLRARDGDWM